MDPPHLRQRRARYMPKRRENLHPAMVALIGRVFEWRYAGSSRWMLDSKHDADMPADVIGLWASDEDLEPVVKAVSGTKCNASYDRCQHELELGTLGGTLAAKSLMILWEVLVSHFR